MAATSGDSGEVPEKDAAGDGIDYLWFSKDCKDCLEVMMGFLAGIFEARIS